MVNPALVLLCMALVHRASAGLPIVIWHGMGDTCCNPLSIGAVKNFLQEKYSVPVLSLNTGARENPVADFISGYYGDVNAQVARQCEFLLSKPELRAGFHLVGFSQGGQFARALVQRCKHQGLNVSTLITAGGQHQGVTDLPGCVIPTDGTPVGPFCQACMSAMNYLSGLPVVRTHSVQSQYIKTPDLERFHSFNQFLSDINNEVAAARKPQYRDNLISLDAFVMIRFSNDTTVVPRDSAWFSWFDGHKIQPLREQPVYTEDWLGLKVLDDTGRLHFKELEGGHMQFRLSALGAILDAFWT